MLFNTNSAIFQLYHGDNALIFNEMMMRYALFKPTCWLDFNSASSAKQQTAGRYVGPLENIIPSQPVVVLTP